MRKRSDDVMRDTAHEIMQIAAPNAGRTRGSIHFFMNPKWLRSKEQRTLHMQRSERIECSRRNGEAIAEWKRIQLSFRRITSQNICHEFINYGHVRLLSPDAI